MKTYIKHITFILVLLNFSSCEDVIDVDVPTGKIRLVVEASIDWEKGTQGNNQTIKLSTSTPYFETNSNNLLTNASVKVTNTNTNQEFVFTNQNDGTFTTTSFFPVLNNSYELEVIYNGETYQATETLMPVVPIKRITQSLEGGFDDTLLDVNVYFDDPVETDNYYLSSYYEQGDLFPFLRAYSDEFVNGNEILDFFEKEEDEDNENAAFQPGDVVDIQLYGISEAYYNYMRLLIEQYYGGGDPFASTAAEIKGNCINKTNSDNYSFGYFRVSEVIKTSYTFQ